LENFVEPESQGVFKTIKDLWQGPEKSYINMPLGKAMAWYGDMMAMMAPRDAQMAEDKSYPEFLTMTKGHDCELFEKKGDEMSFYKKKNMAKLECASICTGGNARGLGKIAAIMANKGTLNDTTLMTPETWEVIH
jgi:hypothetical protein